MIEGTDPLPSQPEFSSKYNPFWARNLFLICGLVVLIVVVVSVVAYSSFFSTRGVANTDSIPLASSSATPKPNASAPASLENRTDPVATSPSDTVAQREEPEPLQLNPKVFLLVFNPIIESRENKRLIQVKGWNNPEQLSQQYIDKVKEFSGDFVNYAIVMKQEVDNYNKKENGFEMTDDYYLENCVGGKQDVNCDALADYSRILDDFDVCEKVNKNEIDELWMFGAPWFGYYESRLAGPKAFWYNSPPLTTSSCQYLLPIMGFSYERGVGEMLEDLGHRTESVMKYVYGSWSADESTPWNKFTLLDVDKSSRGGCGNVHSAVNSLDHGYEWGVDRTVLSSCEDFLNYPNLTGKFTEVNCTTWGCNNVGYFKWWFSHLPKARGKTDGKLNNWWRYIIDTKAVFESNL